MNNDQIDEVPVTANGQYTIPEAVTIQQRTTKSTSGYDTYNNNTTINTQLLNKNNKNNKKYRNQSDDTEYSDDDAGYNPLSRFKNPIDDNVDNKQGEKTKCWCTIL